MKRRIFMSVNTKSCFVLKRIIACNVCVCVRCALATAVYVCVCAHAYTVQPSEKEQRTNDRGESRELEEPSRVCHLATRAAPETLHRTEATHEDRRESRPSRQRAG